MATTIGTLTIDMAANVARLQADMQQARSMVSGAAVEIQRAAEFAKGALASIGAGLSIEAVVSTMTRLVGELAELDDAAEAAGASVENMSRLMVVGAEAGKSLQDVVGIAAQLQKAMVGAEQDTSKASVAFKALGLDLSKFGDSAEALEAFAKALNQYEDGAGKTQFAIMVLGRAGAQALPFLKDLGEAGKINATISAQQAAEAEKLEKAFAGLHHEAEIGRMQLISQYIPAWAATAKEFREARAAGFGLVEALLLVAGETKQQQIAKQAAVVKGLREELDKGASAAWRFFDPGWEERNANQLAIEEKKLVNLADQNAEEVKRANAIKESAGALLDKAAKVRADEEAQKAANAAAKAGAAEQEALNRKYADIVRGIGAKNSEMVLEIMNSGKLSEAQKFEADERERVAEILGKLSPLQRQRIEDLIREGVTLRETRAEQEADKEAKKLELSVMADLSKRRDEATTSLRKQIDEAEKATKTTIEENEKIGLTKGGLVELTASRWDEKAALVSQQIEQNGVIVATGDEFDALTRLAAEYRRNAEQIRAGGRLTAITDEAEKAKAAWDKQADSIGSSLTDALLRGFESGKDFGKNFAETLKNLFKTLILKPIIQPIAQNAAGSLMSLLGLGTAGTAGASTGGVAGGANGASTIGGIGNLLSGGGGLASLFGAGTGVGGAATTFATSSLGTMLGLSETVGGVGVGLTGAGSSLVSTLGAIPGWGWAIAGGLALAGILGKKRGGPKLGGSFSTTGERLFTPSGADSEAGTLGQSALSGITDLAAQLGGSASGLSLGLGFDSDPQGTAGNRIASFLRDASGRSIYNNVAGRDVGRDDATLQASLGDETSRLILAGLKAADLPTAVRDFLATVDLSTVTSASMDGVIAEAKRIAAQEASWQPLVNSADAAASNAMGPQAGAPAGSSGDWYGLGPNTANASAPDGMGPAGALAPIAQPLVQIGDAVQILTDPASPLTTAAESTATSTASISRVQEDLLSIAREQRDDQRTIGRAQAEANTSIIEQLNLMRSAFERINIVATMASVRPA